MAKELILAKYGEMALKGLNRGTFEDILMKNLRRRLKKFGAFKLNRAQSTIYMEPLSDTIDLDEVLEQLQCVFGIAALCRACVCEKTMEDISAKAVSYLEEVLQGANTFKVDKACGQGVSAEVAGDLRRVGRYPAGRISAPFR